MAYPGDPAPHPVTAAEAAIPSLLAERDARFRDEARRYDLRFRCRDCSHVVPSTMLCSLGFPNALLRDVGGAFDERGELAFCKYFEL